MGFFLKLYHILTQLTLRFSVPTVHLILNFSVRLLLIFLLFNLGLLDPTISFCMDSGDPLEIPAGAVTLEELFLEVEKQQQLAEIKAILVSHEKIGENVLELRRQEGMRIPGGFQTERLVEMLEERYGGIKMKEIEQDIRERGLHSQFYKETKSFFNELRREGATEALLRKAWQGRSTG